MSPRFRSSLISALFVAAGAISASCAFASSDLQRSGNQAPQDQTEGANSVEPERPKQLLDTTYTPPRGRTIVVRAGSDLQQALDSVKPGEVIALDPEGVFVGNFTLRKKTGSGWIVIRSSAEAKLPPSGTRITPGVTAMPKLFSPNPDPVIRTEAGAHHYRLIGLELGVAPGVELNYNLVSLGHSSQTSEQMPHNLIIDRCYIHGTSTGNQRRGVALNSASTAIIDSHISDCHEVGADSQAICGWNGPGPFKIVNNYLEGAGENVLFGGADPSIPDLVPSDIEFRQNHCRKPLSWKSGNPGPAGPKWSIKNILELKNARRVLIEGNLLENNWVNSQNGYAILFTPRNQDGSAPWSVVEDVTFAGNVVRNTASGINILGRDYNHPSKQTRRIKIVNNLFYDIDGTRWGGGHGAFILMTSSPAQIVIDHNTVFQSGHIILADGEPSFGVRFTNNIVKRGYGILGSGLGEGNRAIQHYFPDVVLARNVIIGGAPALYSKYADNFFPQRPEEVGFENLSNGFGLTASSRFIKAAVDGGAIGCDVNALRKSLGPVSGALIQSNGGNASV